MVGSCKVAPVGVGVRDLVQRCTFDGSFVGLFDDLPESLMNTGLVAERAGFEPALGLHLNTLSRRAT